MKLGLSVTPVVAQTRIMKSYWTVEMADDLRDVQDINLNDMLADEMKRSQYANDVNELFGDEDEEIDYQEVFIEEIEKMVSEDIDREILTKMKELAISGSYAKDIEELFDERDTTETNK